MTHTPNFESRSDNSADIRRTPAPDQGESLSDLSVRGASRIAAGVRARLSENTDISESSALRRAHRSPRREAKPILTRVGENELNREEKKKLLYSATRIKNKYSYTTVMSRVLAAMGFGANKDLEQYLNTSAALQETRRSKNKIQDFGKGVNLLADAVSSGKKIAIVCDCDMDGATSGAILGNALRALGANFEVFPVSRKDNHALHTKRIHELVDKGFDTLVALDLGSTAREAFEAARQAELKTMIIDHHLLSNNVSEPDVFINPSRPGCGFANGIMCASGLTYLVVDGLRHKLMHSHVRNLAERAKSICMDDALALAAIGTKADVGSLVHQNRGIVAEGLRAFGRSSAPGYIAMREIAGIIGQPTSTDIAFYVGPLGNAPGRMEENGAKLIVDLFMAQTLPEARDIARRAQHLNTARKKKTEEVYNMARNDIERQGRLKEAIVCRISGTNIQGVIGPVAARLSRELNRPVFLFTPIGNGLLAGSVRGINDEVSLTELIAKTGLCEEFGGHKLAAGARLRDRNFKAFERSFVKLYRDASEGADNSPVEKGHVEVTLKELQEGGMKLLEELNLLEPTGKDNEAAKFTVRKAQVVAVSPNQERNFMSVKLRQGDTYMTAMIFKATDHPALKQENFIDLVCKVSAEKGDAYRPQKRLVLEFLAAQGAE